MGVCNEYQVPIKTYINNKIRMLQKDFWMGMTKEEIEHMKSLKTEIDVDHYAYDLIMRR